MNERPQHRSWSRFWRLGSVAVLAVIAAMATASVPRVAACSGGYAFDWAVAHARGGILEAQVSRSTTRADYSTDIELTEPKVVRGDPPTDLRVRAIAGDPCDQSADPGDVIAVLFGIQGGPVDTPLPFYYVIEGPDALSPGDVADALGGQPSTDAASLRPTPNLPKPVPVLALLVTAAGGLVAGFRRTRRP